MVCNDKKKYGVAYLAWLHILSICHQTKYLSCFRKNVGYRCTSVQSTVCVCVCGYCVTNILLIDTHLPTCVSKDFCPPQQNYMKVNWPPSGNYCIFFSSYSFLMSSGRLIISDFGESPCMMFHFISNILSHFFHGVHSNCILSITV